MYEHFSAEFFIANRQRLRTLFSGTAPIVVTANGQLQRTGTVTYPYRQDSNFWYLTGINVPDVVLVMDKDKEYLIVPEREEIMEVFDGKVTTEELQAVSGISTVMNEKEGWKKLGGRLGRTKHVATISAPPDYIEGYAFYTNPARARLISRIKEINADLELLNLQPHFQLMRAVKQAPEIQALQHAIDVTVQTFKAIRKKTLAYEYEYEAAVLAAVRKQGIANYGYGSIIAAGKHACTMHHMSNDGPVLEGDLVLFDIGAEVENYTADITRTYAFTPPTKRQQAVFNAVAASQDYGFSLIKPGVSIRDNEKLMEEFIGEKLRELGLIKTISRDSVREFYPHALSHYLGLDAHDAGDYDRPLQPGMVLTVEPGIYIPAEGIGIRIEDDVLVTPDGFKNLSENLPRTLYA